MTTAYTSLLGLALPVTGELSGTWGDTVNNSITSLLDSAIAGTTTISSDADVTLTTTTGAANTSREAILLWTAGGTVTRNITAPAQSKVYIVINASSSTQSIVLRGVGPTTGVTIIKGEAAVCAWNGSDFVKVANTSGAGVFSSITNSGLTSGRVVYSTTGGLETSSANLLFDGTTLTVANRGIATASMPAGSVLQVVQGSYSASFSTTSSSYVSTGASATITPTSSTSKILAQVSVNIGNQAYNWLYLTLYRGSTNISTVGSTNPAGWIMTNSVDYLTTSNFQILDSPATTSATTYTLYIKGQGNSVRAQVDGMPTYITLIEVAA
jgi:hypothetical protein